MAGKKPKYLVDSAAVRPAIEKSTPQHFEEFRKATADGTLWSSTYVRMECIRLWICAYIRTAILIDSYHSVSAALVRIEQDFHGRRIKASMAVLADYLATRGVDHRPRAAAEEIGRLAVRWLQRFDKVFASRIPNSCKCQIGGSALQVDFDHLLPDLRSFYESFREPVTDCEVNAFLRLGARRGRTGRLLASDDVLKLRVGEQLARYRDQGSWITCTECSKIGDAVIALELPKPYTLVSADASFLALCKSLGRSVKQIPSVVAVDRDAYPDL
jgi:hypothetical protein